MPKLIDLSGQRFGSLAVIQRVGTDKHGKVTYLCLCDCGKEKVVSAGHLRQGLKSCGCKSGVQYPSRANDLAGSKFGKLTVVRRYDKGVKHGEKALWLCRCDCGKETILKTSDLTTGNTKSCGCYRVECNKARLTKHGDTATRIYRIWRHMKDRCGNPKNVRYKDYGGRGIAICKEWQNSFEAFRDWAMDNGYDDSLSIDRIDNNSGYRPDNCRWATMKEQRHNRRDTNKKDG